MSAFQSPAANPLPGGDRVPLRALEGGRRRALAVDGMALVDFGNYHGTGQVTPVSAEAITGDVLDLVAKAYRGFVPAVQAVDVRLYGGWFDESGQLSADAQALLPALAWFRGRRDGILVRPSLALSLLVQPDFRLHGTVRFESTRRKRQKMVDAMLGCDAVHLASAGGVLPAVFTDDDDLVPAILMWNATRAGEARWVRRSLARPRPNDARLSANGVALVDGEKL